MKKFTVISILSIISMFFTFLIIKPGNAVGENAPVATITTGEGIDFATRVLGDPWDMSNFTDISQWLNHAPGSELADIQVTNGVFSARTLSSYSEFFPLFPGYEPGTNSGKIGARFPIDSNTYSCFFMAMKVNWGAGNNFYSTFWAPDRYTSRWSDPSQVWGLTYGNNLWSNQWALYSTNLKTHPNIQNKPWTYQQSWQAFRITPSMVANAQFSVDWIRLTNCQPVYANLSGLAQGTFNLFLGAGSPERQILIKSFSPSSGSYAWDVQGLPEGSYTYYVKTSGGSTVQQGQLTIVGTPIVTFTSPSPYSGPDYANHQGNPWDIDASDITRIECATYGFNSDILFMDTPNRSCAGPGANEAEPKIFLNSTDHGYLDSYRYLSFSSRTDGGWSVPDLGMILRLIWRLDRPGEDCYYVSRGIPVDVGWHTYSVDLYDAWNGTPEEFTPGSCPSTPWLNQRSIGPVVGFRIDPNENITGASMHQEFDWIRLTKVQQAARGSTVKVKVLLNKPAAEVNLNFFYTTNLALTDQNIAETLQGATLALKNNLVFLPVLLTSDPNYDPFFDRIPADVTYSWNTSGVNPGEYYLCAQASDGYNQATYCSQAPILISP